jgi:pimeloyl-ACP methyl ester carboxylesterase
MGQEILPFLLDVPEAQLADLRRRLRATRWPEPEPVPDWSQGVPLAYLRDLCEYWAQGYDWRPAEARLNALPLFQTEIDGLSIVFAHVRSPRPDALPLILTQGCSVFPRELQRPSRRWAAKRFTDIRYWGEPERGGHFAAFEQPALFVDELRSFFRLVR